MPVLAAPTPPTAPGEATVRTLDPSASICDWTADEEPVPTAIRTITEPTPIINPRIVSPERSLLAANPESATLTVSVMPPALRPDRAPAGRRRSAHHAGG